MGDANFDASGRIPCCAARAGDTAWPAGLVFNEHDHAIYFADRTRKLLEKVTQDGSVTLVAGHCTRELVWGHCIDVAVDGKGAAAAFGSPMLIGRDSNGSGYYVWDDDLRHVSSAGNVATIAKSDDSSDCMCSCPTHKHPMRRNSRPCYITSMAFNQGDHHLYVIDYYRLKRLDLTGTLTTIKLPHITGKYRGLEAEAKGLTFSPTGELLVLDAGDSIVLVESNGSARLIAGCGTHPGTDMFGNSFCQHDHRDGNGAQAMFDEIEGLAYDPDDNAIYVADQTTIRRVSLGGEVTTLVGTCAVDADGFNRCAAGFRDGPRSTARFGTLAGITYDPDDHNLYVSDVSNHAIRRITRAGTVSTVAKLPPASGPFPSKWSADFAAPGGYLMHLWVDGTDEQERYYWHGVLYAVRTGFRRSHYGFGLRPFDVPEGFYRIGQGSAQAPAFVRPSTSLCGGYNSFSSGHPEQRIEWSENLLCRSIRVLEPSGAILYGEVEYLFIPHEPLHPGNR